MPQPWPRCWSLSRGLLAIGCVDFRIRGLLRCYAPGAKLGCSFAHLRYSWTV